MIDVTADIRNAEIAESSMIHRFARVNGSKLVGYNTVEDLSSVDFSELEEFSRVGCLNKIHYSKLGRHSYTGMNTVMLHVNVGSFCSVSWNVSIGGANHDYRKLTTHSFLYNGFDNLRPKDEPIAYDRFGTECNIGNDVYIGANACICRGVTVGDGAVIGAGAIITKDVPAYAVVVGNPAKVIKYRFSQEKIADLLQLQWWNWSDEKIKANFEMFRG